MYASLHLYVFLGLFFGSSVSLFFGGRGGGEELGGAEEGKP